ncbi:unnamed protein product [Effrenium voratum]|uniref:Uncharacterized protein n=1 Tax=Effrenium voratum TaxID=2562239 RepID=A0AA36JGS0_9DINO|nr:unnamed protein product [Effrenium voratum]
MEEVLGREQELWRILSYIAAAENHDASTSLIQDQDQNGTPNNRKSWSLYGCYSARGNSDGHPGTPRSLGPIAAANQVRNSDARNDMNGQSTFP